LIPLKDTIPSQRYPVVTVTLIAINVLVFFYELSLGGAHLNQFVNRYGIVPARYTLAKDADLISLYLPFLTAMFLHGGWLHIIGNMLYLWIFGDNVEDRLGRGRFLIFYLLCGLVSGFAQVYISPTSRVPMIGASGAIAGVLGGYFLLYPHSRIVTLVPIFFFLQLVEIPAFFFLLFWFLLQFFYGSMAIAYTAQQAQGGVAWWAHVGGFICGLLLVKVFATKKERSYERIGMER